MQYIIAGLKPCGCVEIAAWEMSMNDEEKLSFMNKIETRGLDGAKFTEDEISDFSWNCEKCAN